MYLYSISRQRHSPRRRLTQPHARRPRPQRQRPPSQQLSLFLRFTVCHSGSQPHDRRARPFCDIAGAACQRRSPVDGNDSGHNRFACHAPRLSRAMSEQWSHSYLYPHLRSQSLVALSGACHRIHDGFVTSQGSLRGLPH
eukprot:6195176-Pleurochrysis_carterae.AAC.1